METDLVQPGDRVGQKWIVKDVLGRGTYGQVYRATNKGCRVKRI